MTKVVLNLLRSLLPLRETWVPGGGGSAAPGDGGEASIGGEAACGGEVLADDVGDDPFGCPDAHRRHECPYFVKRGIRGGSSRPTRGPARRVGPCRCDVYAGQVLLHPSESIAGLAAGSLHPADWYRQVTQDEGENR